MRLTKFSDYALRVLVFAASVPEGRRVTIAETAAVYGISQGHLKRVVMLLTHAGFLHGERGRSGGYRLAAPADRIRLGAVVRATEADFAMVECFQTGQRCRIEAQCRIPPILSKATAAFLDVLDDYTLADIALEARFLPPGPMATAAGADPRAGSA